MMRALLDLHVHTSAGSLDSRLSPGAAVQAAQARGLDGIAVTEHFRIWSEAEVQKWSSDSIAIFPASEVSTDAGHVLVFGLPSYPTTRTLRGLTMEAKRHQAALVLAHPFRGALDSPHHWLAGSAGGDLVSAAAARVRGLAHAIEVANSGCTDAENHLASELARVLGLPAVGGSDAHDASLIGAEATVFPRLPANSQELAAALRAAAPVDAHHGVRPVAPQAAVSVE